MYQKLAAVFLTAADMFLDADFSGFALDNPNAL